jgi:hypothetical protein
MKAQNCAVTWKTTETNEYEYKIISRKLTISHPFHLDISFAIGCVNRFMTNLQISHMDVAKNILRYFEGLVNSWDLIQVWKCPTVNWIR